MAVRIESTPISVPTRKTRLLNGLVRHASAPAYPHMKLGRPASGPARRSTSKPAPFRPSASLTRPFAPPLNDLAITQSLCSRLRLERDTWRDTAQRQEQQLLAREHGSKQQQQCIAVLQDEITALRTAHADNLALTNKLSARLHDMTASHDKLAHDLAASRRESARLKRSDRAKGKVAQRNLTLKATLRRYTSQALDAGTEAALMEALGVARERIEELERKGLDVLVVLEGGVDGGEDYAARMARAGGALRDVIEDEEFEGLKEHWGDLMGE